MGDSCVALALSVPPSPALSMATKSVEELCARLKTGGIPDQFCEAFKGKVAKFCLVCSNFSSYGIAGYFRGVLIFVIFVVKPYGTKFSTHENFRSMSKQVLKSMCGRKSWLSFVICVPLTVPSICTVQYQMSLIASFTGPPSFRVARRTPFLVPILRATKDCAGLGTCSSSRPEIGVSRFC